MSQPSLETPPNTPETLPVKQRKPQTWRQKHSLSNLKTLIREQMLLKGNRASHANLDASQKAAWGDKYVPPDLDDDMIVNDTDLSETHLHYHYENETPPVDQKTPQKKGLLGKLLPVALGAGLLATGVGAGAAIPLLTNWWNQKETKTIVTPGTTKVLQGRATVVGKPARVIEPEGE